MKEILTLYHGTYLKNASSIIKDNYRIINNKNWMGRGAYFFYEDIFAFTWCVDLYKSEVSKSFDKKVFIRTMTILENRIEIESERLLDLTYFKGQEVIDIAYKKLLTNKKYKVNLENAEPREKMAIVIEFLFEKNGFKKNYDAIKQMYRLHTNNYINIFSNREKGIPQYQICVKNNNIIKNISIYKFDDKIESYRTRWENMINDTTFHKIGEYDFEEYSYGDNNIKYCNKEEL